MKSDAPAITMYTTKWCGDCFRSKRIFEDMKVAYNEIDIDQDKDAAQKVMDINGGNRSVPTIMFPDGSHLSEPDSEELKEKLMSLHKSQQTRDKQSSTNK